MTVQEIVRPLLPKADLELLAYSVNLVTDEVLNYCYLETLPDGLKNVVARMVLDAWRQSNFGNEQLEEQRKGVSRGDTSFSFATPAEQMQASIQNPSFMQDYKAQLNAHRKMR